MDTQGILWLLPLVVILTSTLSGIFGMAGGMILMGILAAFLPVPTAMVLHAVTQMASNGSRAWLLRRDIEWRIVGRYVLGALPALGLFLAIGVVADKATLYIVMGAIPLVVASLPRGFTLSITSRPVAVGCGFVVSGAHLLAGVSGPLLDVFFVRGRLTRHEVIGTKALTQTLSHLLKLGYFGMWIGAAPSVHVPAGVFVAVVLAATLGSALGKRVLQRLSDARFRHYSLWLVRILACLALTAGLGKALG
jgi:uncharacterized membrane protein YfcA